MLISLMTLLLIAHKVQLGISGFGISVTTMEEVFIKVGENNVEEVTHVESGSITDPLLTDNILTSYDNVITGCLCTDKNFTITSYLLFLQT